MSRTDCQVVLASSYFRQTTCPVLESLLLISWFVVVLKSSPPSSRQTVISIKKASTERASQKSAGVCSAWLHTLLPAQWVMSYRPELQIHCFTRQTHDAYISTSSSGIRSLPKIRYVTLSSVSVSGELQSPAPWKGFMFGSRHFRGRSSLTSQSCIETLDILISPLTTYKLCTAERSYGRNLKTNQRAGFPTKHWLLFHLRVSQSTDTFRMLVSRFPLRHMLNEEVEMCTSANKRLFDCGVVSVPRFNLPRRHHRACVTRGPWCDRWETRRSESER